MAKPLHKGMNQLGSLRTSPNLLICYACGTQFDVEESEGLSSCRICDDPRQYVPPTGQIFTTMRNLQADPAKYHLEIVHDDYDSKVSSITVQPKVGIGQRAFLIQTTQGNILWDCLCYLDQAAVDQINDLGGISCIVISHPHFWTACWDWSATWNNCPVYLASADQEWLNRKPAGANLQLLTETHNTILPGVTAIICGGHFPGSMALHTAPPNTTLPSLFHADTIYTVPNALSQDITAKTAQNTDHTSYAFMWSIPNMIPLNPDQILSIWKALKGFDIKATYGFTTVRSKKGDSVSIPERILESAKVCVRRMGYNEHEISSESL